MTFEPEEGDFSQVCPYLGLADDADSHATYPTEAHRCYRLPNPTRIATGHQETYCLGEAHVSCPVYQGEGVSRPAAPPAAAAPPREPAMAGATAAPAPARGGGSGTARPPRGQQAREQAQPAGTQRRQQQRRTAPGTLGPRPRAGGISMPVATVGLFAGAIVIALLAAAVGGGWFGGGGDDDDGPPTLPSRTSTAVQTQQGGGNGTATTQPSTQTQQAGSATPGTSTATRTATGTTTATADEYVVKSGDFCGAIATTHGITLETLLKLNNMTEADCNNLQVGKKLKLK